MDQRPDDDARRELRALVEQYASAADARDPVRFAAVFTPDATLAGSRFTYRGRDQIATVPAKLERYLRTRHVVGDQVVTLAGDRAGGETTCTAHHLYEEGGARRDRVLHIRYQDRYVRIDGTWLIAERTLLVDRTEDEPVLPGESI